MVGRHLEVLTRRRRTRLTWLWLCVMKSKDGIPLVWLCCNISNCMVNMFIFLAHPICLYMAMIVYAVHRSIWCCMWIWWSLSAERGKLLGTVLSSFYHLWFWNKVVNYYETVLVLYWILRNLNLELSLLYNKWLKFFVFLGNWFMINMILFSYFILLFKPVISGRDVT